MARVNTYTNQDKADILNWIDSHLASYRAESMIVDSDAWRRSLEQRERTARKCRDVITGDIFKEGYGANSSH